MLRMQGDCPTRSTWNIAHTQWITLCRSCPLSIVSLSASTCEVRAIPSDINSQRRNTLKGGSFTVYLFCQGIDPRGWPYPVSGMAPAQGLTSPQVLSPWNGSTWNILMGWVCLLCFSFSSESKFQVITPLIILEFRQASEWALCLS